MRDALHPTAGVASLVWSAPSILLSVAAVSALSWSVDVRLGRARRLLDAGRRAEALRVYRAVQADAAADLRRARRGDSW